MTQANQANVEQVKDEQKLIEQLIEKYIEAINASRTDALVSLFTPDGVLMAPDAPTMEGTDQLTAFFNYSFGTIKIDAQIHFDEIFVSGDHGYARTHSQVELTVAQVDATQSEENRELFVVRKLDGEWKISRYMFNKLPNSK